MDLAAGVAIRIRSDDLNELRSELVDRFRGLLSAPDRGGWIAHVTIQNKIDPRLARTFLTSLEKDFSARPVVITGLQLIRYSEGEWKMLARYPFRGVS